MGNMISVKGARGAKKASMAQRGLTRFGAKNLQLGTEYTILLPRVGSDIVLAASVGRQCDWESLGFGFAKLPKEMMQINPDTDRITDLSCMVAWGRISSILYKAAKIRDIEDAKEEALKTAQRSGGKVDEVTLSQTIASIEEAYDGRPKKGEQAAVAPTKKRLLSSNVDLAYTTEGIVIPLDRTLKPVWNSAKVMEITLSLAKINQIIDILDNPNYCDVDDDSGFLEIKFAYVGKDTKEAGRNKFLGVEKAIRKVDLSTGENGEYLDADVRSISSLLKSVSHDGDAIGQRSSIANYAKTPADVDAAMRKYLASNRILTTYIDMEDEATKRSAQDLFEYNVFNTGSKQYEELKAMLEADEAMSAGDDSITGKLVEAAEAGTARVAKEVLDSDSALQEMVAGDDEVIDI